MLDGITVLSQTVIEASAIQTIGMYMLFGFACFCYAFVIVVMLSKNFPLPELIIPALVISIICFCVGLTIHETIIDPHTEYKIAIEDSVSFNDVMDTYEILDQDGQIWLVREKK